MDTQEILFKLEQVKEKEKDKKYFTGELNVYAMVIDVIDFIKEQERTIHSLDCELADIYYPRPYEFEELKRGMPYYHDGLEKFCLLVSKRNKDTIVLSICTEEGSSIVYVDFKKGHFFPPTKAIECQCKED